MRAPDDKQCRPTAVYRVDSVVLACIVIGKMAAAAAYSMAYNYSSELFPTVIRQTACGLGSAAAQVGSILAAQVHIMLVRSPSARLLDASAYRRIASAPSGCASNRLPRRSIRKTRT